ncbi:MAG: DUF4249 domain-containing protein [Cyclobacteriaceae bacterium]
MNRNGYNLSLVLFILFMCVEGCVEPYEIEAREFDRALVIDARLTDIETAHYVKLSYTRPIDAIEKDPISGATVWIENSNGEQIEYKEHTPGLYLSDSSIAGMPGEVYQLKVTTNDGTKYESTQQLLQVSPPIEEIYVEYAEKPNASNETVLGGIQFFLNTKGANDGARFFRYEWEETYEVKTSYPSLYEYLWEEDSAIMREDQLSVCYASGQSSSIILGTTIALGSNRLTGQELRYITSRTDQLKYAYSILARQYAINASAYGFYREIVANNDQGGSLFGEQLGAIIGNISNPDNPDEVVLGFFEVSGVSEKRFFIQFSELDSRFAWPQDKYACSGESVVAINEVDSLVYYVEGQGYGIIRADYCNPNGVSQCPYDFRAELAPGYCTDCRFRGSAEKPDYWIY